MSLIVVEQLQQYLVDQGIANLPAADPTTAKPRVWLQPRQGAPKPQTDGSEWLETQTLTLNDANLTGPPTMEAWLEDTFIDVVVRSKNAAEGKLTLRAIRALLAPIGVLAGRKDWTMHQLHVLYSNIWRLEQPLPPVENGLTYDRVASFRFRCARSDLT